MKKRYQNNSDFKPYGVDRFSKIPTGVKVGILKFIVAGAFFYLVFNNISNLLGAEDSLEVALIIIVIGGIILGLIQEYVINGFINILGHNNKEMRPYMLIKKTKLGSLFLNLIYGVVIMVVLFPLNSLLVMNYLTFTNLLALPFTLAGGLEPLPGSCPFTFALLYVLIDFVFIFGRNKTEKIIINKKKKESKKDVKA